jgi:signal transduction histidine kinase
MLPQCSGKSILLETTIEPGNMELKAGPGLIEEVLINLVMNAMQALAGNAGGTIRLCALLDGRGRFVIEVTDNGPGITGEQMEKIFVSFHTTKPAGSGIGLSLCREIMRMH